MSNQKFLLTSIILVVLSLALAGCGGLSTGTTSDAAAAAPSALKVAILLPSPIDDHGWSQAAYEGLQLIEQELGAQIAYTAEVSEADAEQVARQYAQENYDFIVGHGGEYIEALEVVAEEFPRTKFAVMAGYGGNNKNFGALSFKNGELGYLAGVVAALKTKTNKLIFVGGEPYAHMMEQATLFERGAKATNPAVEVSTEWVGWTDEDKAREVTEAHIEAGADVLLVNADTAGLASIEVAASNGLYIIGSSRDQHDLAPDNIVTSGVQKISVLLLEGATLVQRGQWEGKQYKFGLNEGVQELAPYYGLMSSDEQTQVKAVMNDIMAGKIDVTP